MILGVNVAIFEDGKILLTKRADFHVWCMPGGTVDPNETLAQAAAREAREETGLEVRLTRLVGIYSRPDWSDGGSHVVLFAGEPIGGALNPDAFEVAEAAWFEVDSLPEPLLIGHQRRIQDAAAGIGGSAAVNERISFPPGLPEPRLEQYARRDASRLAPDDFYQQVFGPQDGTPEVEVEGKTIEQASSA